MKIPVWFRWNEAKREWHMLDFPYKNFLYEIRDCKNMIKMLKLPERKCREERIDGEEFLRYIEVTGEERVL